MSEKSLKIWFHNNGDLMYRAPYYGRSPISGGKLEDNCAFQDRMKYCYHFRNAILFESLISGKKYYMSVKHFDLMMKEVKMHMNIIEGDFTFIKCGNAQGIKMILTPSI